MEIEVIEKDTKQIRLTLTKTRVTIKFPLGYDLTKQKKIIDFVKVILNNIVINNSLRGRFDDNGITLSNDYNTEKRRFVF